MLRLLSNADDLGAWRSNLPAQGGKDRQQNSGLAGIKRGTQHLLIFAVAMVTIGQSHPFAVVLLNPDLSTVTCD